MSCTSIWYNYRDVYIIEPPLKDWLHIDSNEFYAARHNKIIFFPFNSNPKSESVDNPLYERYELWIYLLTSREQSLSSTSLYLKARDNAMLIEMT